MKNKLVSIIIPVYNQSEIIRKTVQSILDQTYKEVEVIIINDGSTDNLMEEIKIIENDIKKYNINYIFITQKNSGAPSARNLGFKKSQGEYLLFLDADTIMKKIMIEKMVEVLDKKVDFSYVYSGLQFGWKKFFSYPFDPDLLKKNNYIDTSSMVRRVDFPGFDESLKRFQDWDLWLTLLGQNKIGYYLPDILYKKITKGRPGMSKWLPKIFYKLPFKIKSVKKFEEAKKIIIKKHFSN